MDNDDEQDTPPTRYLTDSERREHLGTLSESGSATPRSLFEIAIDKRVGDLESSRSFWKWIAGIAIPLLVLGAFGLLGYSVDKIASSSEHVGRTAEKIEALEKTIASDKASLEQILRMLEEDIRELRKHAGLEPKPVTFDGRIGALP